MSHLLRVFFWLLPAFLICAPCASWAQEDDDGDEEAFESLDLDGSSEEPEKKDEPEPEKKTEEQPPEMEKDDKATAQSDEPAESKPVKVDVEMREDRIKSVQRKVFLKRRRWEVSPAFSASLNDAFYQKVGGAASIAFYPTDGLGIEVHAAYVGTVQTDMVKYFQQANQALPRVSHLAYYVCGDLLWSPFYGKLAFVTDDILHFDAYLIGGFGMAYTETGAKLATNLGIGLRYYLSSWLAIKVEVRDLMYVEKLTMDTVSTEFSDIQNHVVLSAGASFYLPTDFDYDFQ